MTADFAHPVERELARLFDEHGIAWEYEPRTFVLEQDDDGNVREGFTPDFFLPEIGLYLECTVMRQALTRRKRRKARKTHERTGVIVELVFRRDFDRLARRWGFTALSAASRSDATEVSRGPLTGTAASAMTQTRLLDDAGRIRIDVERSAHRAIVTVAGDVDLHSAPELRDRLGALARDGVERVVVDLSECSFLDSMGLGVLLGAKKRMARDDRQLEIVVANPDVRRIFEITMLDRVFELHATRTEALGGATDRDAGTG